MRCTVTPGSALLALALGCACSVHGSQSAMPRATTAPPGEAAEGPNTAIPSCKDVGLLGCDVPPSPLDELCSHSAPCLVGSDEMDHERPARDFKCDPPLEALLAPPGTGLYSTALIHIDAGADPESMDSSWREEAWYLAAETPRGYCLVSPLLSWELEKDWWWENAFRFSWSKQNGPAPELTAEGQFIAMIDEEGERFPDHQYCKRHQYRVSGGRLSLLEKKEAEERCFPDENAEPAP